MTEIQLRPHWIGDWNFNKKLPNPNELHPENGTRGEVDIRNMLCENDDLSMYSIEDISFDHKTQWPTDPKKLPKGFEQKDKIMELGKNPGLGIHQLHERGIDGTRMRMAIIDQSLSDHEEYHDNLVHYEEFGDVGKTGAMHGSAVSSIAVGKTCGVAPKAKLYYFAFKNVKRDPKTGEEIRFTDNCVKALEKIIAINNALPSNEKIQIVSMSWGGQSNPGKRIDKNECEKWTIALKKAKKAGLFVLTVASEQEYGLAFLGAGRGALGDPENGWNKRASGLTHQQIQNVLAHPYPNIIVPMDDRTTASPLSPNGYVHYMSGGMSWATPWLAGMFVLARQVDPSITPEHFWEVALKTGVLNKEVGGTVIQPLSLIDTLEKERAHALGKDKENTTPSAKKKRALKKNNLMDRVIKKQALKQKGGLSR